MPFGNSMRLGCCGVNLCKVGMGTCCHEPGIAVFGCSGFTGDVAGAGLGDLAGAAGCCAEATEASEIRRRKAAMNLRGIAIFSEFLIAALLSPAAPALEVWFP